MRFMIRCDIEGVTGVVHPDQAAPTGPEYAYGVDMLHNDLNAVVDGILSTGEHDIVIYDMHYYGRNLDMARLDPRVKVICGKPNYKPGNVGGLTAGFDGQILLGLHSKAGTGELLAHSYEHQVQDILLNDVSVGEIGLEAALAGELDVPTVLVTADTAGCAEAEALIPGIATVAVKESISLHAGVCYPAEKASELLFNGGIAAVEKASTLPPYITQKPVTLAIVLENGPFADHVRANLQQYVQPDGRIVIDASSVAAAWEQYLLAKPIG